MTSLTKRSKSKSHRNARDDELSPRPCAFVLNFLNRSDRFGKTDSCSLPRLSQLFVFLLRLGKLIRGGCAHVLLLADDALRISAKLIERFINRCDSGFGLPFEARLFPQSELQLHSLELQGLLLQFLQFRLPDCPGCDVFLNTSEDLGLQLVQGKS